MPDYFRWRSPFLQAILHLILKDPNYHRGYQVVFLVIPDYPEAFRGLHGRLCVIAAYLCHRAVIN